jgi:outer membrane usher protein FimD/PapC
VRVPGYPDVRVYSQNREIGRTDRSGEFVVPRLRCRTRPTRVRIDQSDLPLGRRIFVAVVPECDSVRAAAASSSSSPSGLRTARW